MEGSHPLDESFWASNDDLSVEKDTSKLSQLHSHTHRCEMIHRSPQASTSFYSFGDGDFPMFSDYRRCSLSPVPMLSMMICNADDDVDDDVHVADHQHNDNPIVSNNQSTWRDNCGSDCPSQGSPPDMIKEIMHPITFSSNELTQKTLLSSNSSGIGSSSLMSHHRYHSIHDSVLRPGAKDEQLDLTDKILKNNNCTDTNTSLDSDCRESLDHQPINPIISRLFDDFFNENKPLKLPSTDNSDNSPSCSQTTDKENKREIRHGHTETNIKEGILKYSTGQKQFQRPLQEKVKSRKRAKKKLGRSRRRKHRNINSQFVRIKS